MRHEEMQQAVLRGPQGDFAFAGTDPVARIVELEAVGLHDVGGPRRRGAAQHGLDACQQFPRGKRLGNVVVGAALEAAHLVLFLGASREHDDRDLFGILGALQGSGQLQSAHIRQHPVDQHQIRPHVDDSRPGLAAVFRLPDFIAGAPQAEGDHVANRFFVFDYEDALGCHVAVVP